MGAACDVLDGILLWKLSWTEDRCRIWRHLGFHIGQILFSRCWLRSEWWSTSTSSLWENVRSNLWRQGSLFGCRWNRHSSWVLGIGEATTLIVSLWGGIMLCLGVLHVISVGSQLGVILGPWLFIRTSVVPPLLWFLLVFHSIAWVLVPLCSCFAIHLCSIWGFACKLGR